MSLAAVTKSHQLGEGGFEMPFFHSYLGMSFRDFLHAGEERERHLLHEVGHVWFG